MEIQRHNIFDLIGERQNLYHSAILTSYTFDPIFFESFYLPRLRQCGISNVIVLLDASNYDQMLSQYPSFGLQSERRLYTLVRQSPTNNGVFHPKITMLFGEDTGILIVGSGNLTYNGHAINEEVWNTFSLKGTESVYLPLFRGAWNYLNSLHLPPSILLNQQLKWIKDNVNWMIEKPVHNTVTVDRQQCLFMANDAEGSILSKLQKIVGNEAINTITTVSPFYDVSGFTVTSLYNCFKPHEIKCVYSEVGIYPYDLIKNRPDWLTAFSWEDVFKCDRSSIHKLHAKIVQLELPERTILISGSANVTNAAFNGSGDEACIIVISEQPKDYIKDLGIVLNQQSMATQAKLDLLPKLDRSSSKSIERKVQILSAEVIDNTLTVITDGPSTEDFSLSILDTNGKVLHIYEALCKDNKLTVGSFTLTDCIAVIIDSESSEISNRCFIINEDDVARFNPNKVLRKLDSLLESNIDWKDNLAGILSYLWFDNTADIKTSNIKSTTATKTKEVVGKYVACEDFDAILIGGRQTVLSLPDVRIIDFLLSSEKKSKVDFGDSSDDVETIDDVDNGENEYHNSEDVIEKYQQKSAFKDSIMNYSRRLRRHYNARLSDLYATAGNHGENIFHPEFRKKATQVSVIDYSRILIDIVLMWNELAEDINRHHGDIRQEFIRNLGKFLLLARKGYPQTKDYAWHKCVELHKELIVYSFLIIASQNWNRKETITIKLLIANLLNTCSESDILDIDDIVEVFLKKTSQSNIVPNTNSMALIKKTIAEYKIFSQHVDTADYTMVREVDLGLPQGNYAYKPSYGFFFVNGLRSVRQSKGNNNAYELTLHHPGFDEDIKVLGFSKIRALS